ncbi:MAG TPA: hypothetical protein VFQ54_00650, partial [Thermomicrobiales bacterium]|nr:hypothetical protein [Thermomicrobiales bacterium]
LSSWNTLPVTEIWLSEDGQTWWNATRVDGSQLHPDQRYDIGLGYWTRYVRLVVPYADQTGLSEIGGIRQLDVWATADGNAQTLDVLGPPVTPIPVPTEVPAPTATLEPTAIPTDVPVPTDVPTDVPLPTDVPTEIPVPTDVPTEIPVPTDIPTDVPAPTIEPTIDAPVPTDPPADTGTDAPGAEETPAA